MYHTHVAGAELKQLKKDSINSSKAAFAVGTYKNLKIQLESYLLFCTYFQLVSFPATVENLCVYAQFLSRSFKSVQSINNYISGIKTLHLLLNQPFPKDIFFLKLTCRGLTKIKSYCPKRAEPITPELLIKIYAFLDINKSEDSAYWCLFLLAFFLMARKSNLVPDTIGSFKLNKHLSRGQVQVFDDKLIVTFCWTKTIQSGERKLLIPVCNIPGSVLCPVKAFKQMCLLIPGSTSDPAFCVCRKNKNVPITYNQFQSKLRKLINIIGLDPKAYSSHSFRRGGASWAFKSKVSSNLIQMHGDWQSDAYKLYLEFDIDQKLEVSKLMSQNILHL